MVKISQIGQKYGVSHINFLFSVYNFFLKHEIKIATKIPYTVVAINYMHVGSSYVKGSRAQHCGRGTLKQI